jgi:hypothetical protein
MKKIAILIDGEFFSIALRHDLKLAGRPSAVQVYEHARRLADAGTEEIWRIFYYDSRPYAGFQRHPITRKTIAFADTHVARAREAFLAELGQMDLVALRCGKAHPRGWRLSDSYLSQLSRGSVRLPVAEDYELRFTI